MTDGWQPIESAPLERPIAVRMPLGGKYRVAKYWVATAILHADCDHWTDGATIIHYNSNTLQPGFKGPLSHWRELDEAVTLNEAGKRDDGL